jgi:hypothetical protein
VEAFGGVENLTDAVLKNHIFEGNLTADELLRRDEIIAINGQVFQVGHTVTSNRGRRAVLIEIGNNKSETTLTVLDVPSGAGVVHGTDSVLQAASAPAPEKSASSDSGALGSMEWSLVGLAVLLALLFVVVAVVWSRGKRLKQKGPSEKPEADQLDSISWMGRFNPMADDVMAFNRGVDARSPPPTTHFYPDVPLALVDETAPTAKPEKKSPARKKHSKRNVSEKLNTPTHPIRLAAERSRRGPPLGDPNHVPIGMPNFEPDDISEHDSDGDYIDQHDLEAAYLDPEPDAGAWHEEQYFE